MSEMKRVTDLTGSFFNARKQDQADMASFAGFGAAANAAPSMLPLLEEVVSSKDLIDEISQRSYRVSPNFLKLLLHKNSATGWGLRIHSFQPTDDEPIVEPWHEHRWNMASSVLYGRLGSENATADVTNLPVNHNGYFKYHVPDKRVVGKIKPVFVGTCVLNNMFDMSVPAGSTYAHHVDLAHRLVITEPTVTAVTTGPDERDYAAFIEKDALVYKERESPTPLSDDEVRYEVEKVIGLIHSAHSSKIPIPRSPATRLLAISQH